MIYHCVIAAVRTNLKNLNDQGFLNQDLLGNPEVARSRAAVPKEEPVKWFGHLIGVPSFGGVLD